MELDRLNEREAIQLVAHLNRPQAMMWAVTLRERAAAVLPEWGHAQFENQRLQIERLLGQGQLQVAYDQAQTLLTKAQAVEPTAYLGADYDSATAHFLLGRVLEIAGQVTPALELLVEAQQQVDEVQSLLAELTNNPEAPDSLKQLIQAMVAILNGSRDPALADDAALDYSDAAEVLFLIERLGRGR